MGIDQDLRYFKDRDHFEQNMVALVSELIDRTLMADCIVSFDEFNAKTVCVIKVPKSKRPVLFKDQKNIQKFIIRVQNTTRSLGILDSIKYIHEHWPKFTT